MEYPFSHPSEPSAFWKRGVQDCPLEPTRHGAHKRVLLRHEELHSPCMFLNEVYIAPGERVERHQHEDMEEVFYFLAGEGSMQVQEERQPVKAGDCVVVPLQTPHVVENTGTQELRFICFGVKGLPDELWSNWRPT
ncbi:MAG TPA: cupin domain-containing protein [Ktedonobacteraceae bacterium]|nr:cupin domain-containing protein [Ktedonobacteraceae bacterium]